MCYVLNLAQGCNESLTRTSSKGWSCRRTENVERPRDNTSESTDDLERYLDTRFDLYSTLVAATVIASLKCWPEALQAAKGTNLH